MHFTTRCAAVVVDHQIQNIVMNMINENIPLMDTYLSRGYSKQGSVFSCVWETKIPQGLFSASAEQGLSQ